MKRSFTALVVPLMLCLSGVASAGDPPKKCKPDMLKGLYVFHATGFQRPPNSPPGTPWVPKAILSTTQFNGDGTLSTPMITIGNPPGDPGVSVSPPGSDGIYSVEDDCTGLIQYPSGVAHKIFVDAPRGDTVWLIQVSPNGNAFEGPAVRVGR